MVFNSLDNPTAPQSSLNRSSSTSFLRSTRSSASNILKTTHTALHPASRDKDQVTPSSPPANQSDYLRLLGMLLYLTKKSRPGIMAAVSFGASKASKPTTHDQQQLMYIVEEYIRKTPTRGRHRIYAVSGDCRCLIPSPPRLQGTDLPVILSVSTNKEGTFYNRSAKQALVSTPTTHTLR